MTLSHAVAGGLALFASLLAASTIGFGAAASQPAQSADRIVVITAASSPLTDISLVELRRIYLGEASEFRGQRMLPFNYEAGERLRVTFDRVVLEFTPEQTGRYWIDRMIRGFGQAPRTAPSQTITRAAVARFPGAIGYIGATQLDATVRALSIDGRSYQESSYPLGLDSP